MRSIVRTVSIAGAVVLITSIVDQSSVARSLNEVGQRAQPTPSRGSLPVQQTPGPKPAPAVVTPQQGQAAGANTCMCEPPIPSQATATGSCTRTQDDGTFCELAFSLTQRAIIATKLPNFAQFSAQAKLSMPPSQIPSAISQLEAGGLTGRSGEEVAPAVQAVAAVTAAQRPGDPVTQTRFRDIVDMLNLATPADRQQKAPVLRSVARFAAIPKEGELPQIEPFTGASGRPYQLVATSGCIAFLENQFTFMLRLRGSAPSCERPR